MKVKIPLVEVDPYLKAREADPCSVVMKTYDVTGITPERIFHSELDKELPLNYVDEKCIYFRLGKARAPVEVRKFSIFLLTSWLKEHPEQLDDSEVR